MCHAALEGHSEGLHGEVKPKVRNLGCQGPVRSGARASRPHMLINVRAIDVGLAVWHTGESEVLKTGHSLD